MFPFPMTDVNDPTHGFCRDCLTAQASTQRRCTACGSPRVARHGELHALSIAHIDCDAFYASVEKRDRPEIRDKPVIIGGGKRGVVSTACYIARIRGVKSAMPMFKALEACPDAVVIKPDMEKYAAAGRQVRERMRALTPLVEPLSIDEAFLDLTGTEKMHREPPARVLARFARDVERDLGITVSVGLSYCKFLAKVASDLDKPRGFSVIGRAEALSFLAARPVTTIWGVGPALAAKLKADGLTTIGQLQAMEKGDLIRRYQSMGERLYHLSRGEDTRRVEPDHDMKSISAEKTFNDDLSTLDDLVPVLRSLSEKVSARMKAGGHAGHTIVLKLKTADFKSRTRNRHLADPTQLADRIFSHGLELLKREVDGTRFRLIGIGVAELTSPERADPQDLVDVNAGKRAKAEGAMDALRAKFGGKVVETGYTFGRDHRARPQRDTDGD
ncbi:MAG: DNA polymerase IV [Notoacmeibacter sp.]|nr:DNA polymerase IV [Notoacmeibacter sp.]